MSFFTTLGVAFCSSSPSCLVAVGGALLANASTRWWGPVGRCTAWQSCTYGLIGEIFFENGFSCLCKPLKVLDIVFEKGSNTLPERVSREAHFFAEDNCVIKPAERAALKGSESRQPREAAATCSVVSEKAGRAAGTVTGAARPRRKKTETITFEPTEKASFACTTSPSPAGIVLEKGSNALPERVSREAHFTAERTALTNRRVNCVNKPSFEAQKNKSCQHCHRCGAATHKKELQAIIWEWEAKGSDLQLPNHSRPFSLTRKGKQKALEKRVGSRVAPVCFLTILGITFSWSSFGRSLIPLLEKGSLELAHWPTLGAAECTGRATSRQQTKAAATSLRHRLPSVGWQPRKAASTSSVVWEKAFEQRAEETFLLLSAASTVTGAEQPRTTETATFEPNFLPQRRLIMPLLGKGSFQLPLFATRKG